MLTKEYDVDDSERYLSSMSVFQSNVASTVTVTLTADARIRSVSVSQAMLGTASDPVTVSVASIVA